MGLFPSNLGQPRERPGAGGAPVRREVAVDARVPLALVAREMLSETVDSVVIFDATGAVGRVTWRELVRAVAMGTDPQVATAADFMVELDPVNDPFWART